MFDPIEYIGLLLISQLNKIIKIKAIDAFVARCQSDTPAWYQFWSLVGKTMVTASASVGVYVHFFGGWPKVASALTLIATATASIGVVITGYATQKTIPTNVNPNEAAQTPGK